MNWGRGGARRAEQFPHLGNYTLTPALFIANRWCNTTVTGSCWIDYYTIQNDPVIFPVIGPLVLSAANQNAGVAKHKHPSPSAPAAESAH